jgi:hypothetical protein
MSVCPGEEIVTPRRFRRKIEVFAQPFDVTCGMYFACGTDDRGLDRDSGLRDLLGCHGTQRKHVLDARNDGIAIGIVDESASRSALAQGDQACDLERSKSFAKRVSRYTELDRKLALGRQAVAGSQSSLQQLLADLAGNILKGSRDLDAAKCGFRIRSA